MNPPVHSHYCEFCNARYQCLRVGCQAPDVWLCDDCADALMPWPEYDPWSEYVAEEVRMMK